MSGSCVLMERGAIPDAERYSMMCDLRYCKEWASCIPLNGQCVLRARGVLLGLFACIALCNCGLAVHDDTHSMSNETGAASRLVKVLGESMVDNSAERTMLQKSAITEFGDEIPEIVDAVLILIRVIADSSADLSVRLWAVSAVSRLGPLGKPALPALRELYEDPVLELNPDSQHVPQEVVDRQKYLVMIAIAAIESDTRLVQNLKGDE